MEWRLERAHFVENAANGPDVTLQVVGFVLPDFRRRIVGSSGLRDQETFGNFTDVEVSKLERPILIQEQVS